MHLRSFLHAPVKAALGPRYVNHFAKAPFAHLGGLPGTTERLTRWCAALAACVNKQVCPPGIVWLVLSFFQVPQPCLTTVSAPDDDFVPAPGCDWESPVAAEAELSKPASERCPQASNGLAATDIQVECEAPKQNWDATDLEGSPSPSASETLTATGRTRATTAHAENQAQAAQPRGQGSKELVQRKASSGQMLFHSAVAASAFDSSAPDECSAAPSLVISRAQHEPSSRFEGEPVWLHIYDVSGGSVQWMNHLIRPVGSGAFHAGVEILGYEWSFGCAPIGRSGVYVCRPRCNGRHAYRESVSMGGTFHSEEEVKKLLRGLSKEWVGAGYNLLRRNCCHFSDALCRGLGVGPIPPWVLHLADVGASMVQGVEQVLGPHLTHSISDAGP